MTGYLHVHGGRAENSWYNTFLKDPTGQIKCGGNIFGIEGIIPRDVSELTDDINDTYMEKYNYGSNKKYAEGIIKQKHIERTMEFRIK